MKCNRGRLAGTDRPRQTEELASQRSQQRRKGRKEILFEIRSMRTGTEFQSGSQTKCPLRPLRLCDLCDASSSARHEGNRLGSPR